MDDFVTEFDGRAGAKSREACERIEREDAERGSGQSEVSELGEVERRILEAWPRFEDGKPVWLDSRYLDEDGEPQVAHGVQLWAGAGEVMADLIDEDGRHTFLSEEERAREVEEALDSRGEQIFESDAVRSESGEVWTVKSASMHGFLPGYIQVRSSRAMTYFKPHELIRIGRDSWERLEEDAEKEACDYFGVECDEDKGCSGCPHLHEGRDCTIDMQADLVRRAKVLAGVEVE